MTGSENDRVAPSLEDVAAREKASREKLIEDGGPEKQPPDGQSSSEDQPTGTVSEDK